MVNGEEKGKKWPSRAAEAGKKPNEPIKEGPLPFVPFVLLESPFASVSTVSRGHRSLVSLARPNQWKFQTPSITFY
jgi:hypothetical protein